MAHSKLYSPSASHTWLTCTASARLNAEKIRLSNPDADRGTRLHDFCYKEFDNDWDLIDFDSLGDDAEDARTAILAAWELQGMIDDPADIQKEIEVKVLEAEDCFGTADLVMYNSVEKHLLVADYKFGYNEVSAENNPQLLIYALGARRLYAQTGINSITLAIIQPKVICVLGAVAAKALLGPDIAITKVRGQVYDYHGVPLVPTFHPAYLLRNPPAKKFSWIDLKRVKALLDE